MPRLVYTDASGKDVVLGLRDKDVTLGRQADCDLVVATPSTSRRHARVARRGAQWILKDLGSSHGTTVNGEAIQGECVLKIGDRIGLAEAVVRFEEGPAPVRTDAAGFPVTPRTLPTNPAIANPDYAADPSAETGTAPGPGLRSKARPIAPTMPAGVVVARSRVTPAATSAPSPVSDAEPAGAARASGEILEESRLDSGDMMRAMSRARQIELRETATTETGTLLALVRISDELRKCPDESAVCETTAHMSMAATGGSRALVALRKTDGGAIEPQIAIDSNGPADPSGFMISTTFVDKVVREKVGLLAMDTDRDVSLAGAASVVAVGIRSIVCVPLWDGTEILGYVYVDSIAGSGKKGRQFRRGDVDLVTAIGHQAASEIRRLRLAERVRAEEARRRDLARFVSEDVIRHIESEAAENGGLDPTRSVREVLCTILFADLVGFTTLAEQRSPSEVKHLLDDYLGLMTGILIDKHGGTLDKFLGDGIMALFGAPFSRGTSEDARAAVAAALEMRDSLASLRKKRPDYGALQVRIGINSGKVVAGMIGTPRRLEYSVIGDAVNVASRLQAVAGPGEIYIGDPTYQVVRQLFECEFAGEKALKNREARAKAWRVVRALKK